MCSNYPAINLEPALLRQQDKIEHLSSYAHVVHTTAKQVISRRRKNENVFKTSKDGELCGKFNTHVTSDVSDECTRVDVVFDVYLPNFLIFFSK